MRNDPRSSKETGNDKNGYKNEVKSVSTVARTIEDACKGVNQLTEVVGYSVPWVR